jgi:hypothetical protein
LVWSEVLDSFFLVADKIGLVNLVNSWMEPWKGWAWVFSIGMELGFVVFSLQKNQRIWF